MEINFLACYCREEPLTRGMHPLKRALFVEDDPVIGRTLGLSLPYRGYEVTVADTLSAGFLEFQKNPYDILLLDLVLPDGMGFELCRKIREQDHLVPILMLTARTEEDSAVRALSIGADDYVRKPFGLDELTARMNRLIERKAARKDFLHYRSLLINRRERIAQAEGHALSLGPREFEILSVLVEKGGDIVTRDQILDALSGQTDLYDRTIDSHLSHLRGKIREIAGERIRIQSVYGIGYRLDVAEKT